MFFTIGSIDEPKMKRTRSPADERSVVVGLTEEGMGMRGQAKGIYRAISDTFDLTPNRARVARKMLQSIIEKAND